MKIFIVLSKKQKYILEDLVEIYTNILWSYLPKNRTLLKKLMVLDGLDGDETLLC